jgi:hypothetical protein
MRYRFVELGLIDESGWNVHYPIIAEDLVVPRPHGKPTSHRKTLVVVTKVLR